METKYVVVDKKFNILFKGTQQEAEAYKIENNNPYDVIPTTLYFTDIREGFRQIINLYPLAKLKVEEHIDRSYNGFFESNDDKPPYYLIVVNNIELGFNFLLRDKSMYPQKRFIYVHSKSFSGTFRNEINLIKLYKAITEEYITKHTIQEYLPTELKKIMSSKFDVKNIWTSGMELTVDIKYGNYSTESLKVKVNQINGEYTFEVEGIPYVHDSYDEGFHTVQSLNSEIAYLKEKRNRLESYIDFFTNFSIPSSTDYVTI